MSGSETEPEVQQYLDRLRVCGGTLTTDEFEDLWQSVNEHLAEARARGESPAAALRRLGPPEELVDAAASGGPRPTSATSAVAPAGPFVPPQKRVTWLETAALILQAIGLMVFGFGWVVGVALLWSSQRWSVRDKLLGTLAVPGGLGGLLAMGSFVAFGSACSGDSNGPMTCNGPIPGLSNTAGTSIMSAFAVVLLVIELFTLIYLARVASPARPREGGSVRPVCVIGAVYVLVGAAFLAVGVTTLGVVFVLVSAVLLGSACVGPRTASKRTRSNKRRSPAPSQ